MALTRKPIPVRLSDAGTDNVVVRGFKEDVMDLSRGVELPTSRHKPAPGSANYLAERRAYSPDGHWLATSYVVRQPRRHPAVAAATEKPTGFLRITPVSADSIENYSQTILSGTFTAIAWTRGTQSASHGKSPAEIANLGCASRCGAFPSRRAGRNKGDLPHRGWPGVVAPAAGWCSAVNRNTLWSAGAQASTTSLVQPSFLPMELSRLTR